MVTPNFPNSQNLMLEYDWPVCTRISDVRYIALVNDTKRKLKVIFIMQKDMIEIRNKNVSLMLYQKGYDLQYLYTLQPV